VWTVPVEQVPVVRQGLIVCRDGLPGVTSADRAWAEVLRDRCALGGLECLGVLGPTPDGVVRAGWSPGKRALAEQSLPGYP